MKGDYATLTRWRNKNIRYQKFIRKLDAARGKGLIKYDITEGELTVSMTEKGMECLEKLEKYFSESEVKLLIKDYYEENNE